MYHVVKSSRNGRFVQWEIYKDNVLFLLPSESKTFKKAQAYGICNMLNYMPGGPLSMEEMEKRK